VTSKTIEPPTRNGVALRTRLARMLSFARLAGLVTGRKEKHQPEPLARSAAKRASAPEPMPIPAPLPPGPRPQGRRDVEAEGRRAERARCAAIIQTLEARRNLTLAVDLATQTDLTAAQAIAVLAKAPVAAAVLHPDRAARNPRIAAAGDVQRSPEQAAVARMDHALKQANPSTRQAPLEFSVSRPAPQGTAA
jgi:hypothetical protein